MITLKQFTDILLAHIDKVPFEKVNRVTSYILLAFLFGPHGAKECIQGSCTGPNFVDPMLFTFFAPNWKMDMSLNAWGVQCLFSVPLIVALYFLFRFSKTKYGKLLEVYIVRWGIIWLVILWYYNFIFWSGPLREYIFPLFIF